MNLITEDERQRYLTYKRGFNDAIRYSNHILCQIETEISELLTNAYDEGIKEKAVEIVDKYITEADKEVNADAVND